MTDPPPESANGELGELAGRREENQSTVATVPRPPGDVKERSRKPEPPYCWQAKEWRKTIRDHYDGDHFGACCLGVYDAMTEIASDEQAETFTTMQSHIAKKACLGVTTVKKALPRLRELGAIEYETPKLRGPITFTLVATRLALAKTRIRCDLSTVEESKEESEKNLKKKPQEVTSDFIAQQQSLFPNVNVEQEYTKAKAWTVTNRRKCTVRFFENWLARAKPDPAVGKKYEEW